MKRKHTIVFALVLIAFGLTACGGDNDSSDSSIGGFDYAPPSSPASTTISTITGSAVKGPVEGAEIHLFYFDENGLEVEIYPTTEYPDCFTSPPDPWPVLTTETGSFSFPVDGECLMGITSSLIVRTEGGSMNGVNAPVLEAVMADPQPLTFNGVTLACHLSVASSVAARLLRNYAASIDAAPTLDDANHFVALVEDQLRVDLSEDPWYRCNNDPCNTKKCGARTKISMFNESIDQNLNLQEGSTADEQAGQAIDNLIDYFVANLSSSSGVLDDQMDDPMNRGTDTEASFSPYWIPLCNVFGSVGPVSEPAHFVFMYLDSDVAYIENDGIDTANITATLMDATGQPVGTEPCDAIDEVQMGLSDDSTGTMMSAGLSFARGEVMGELTSDSEGDNCIWAHYILPNLNTISLNIVVHARDSYVDTDGDGLPDVDEEKGQTIYIDTLGFGMTAWYLKLESRDVKSDPTKEDTDGDGLDDCTEFIMKTDPEDTDTDGDGLTDYEELNRWQTNPLTVDTDFDAGGLDERSPNPLLFDGSELSLYRTSPSLQDTDGDGRTDFEEIFLLNRNPLVSDLPKLEMEIVDVVDARLDVTYAEEVGETYQYGAEMMKSETKSHSTYNENSMELGVEVGYEQKVGVGKAEGTFSVKFSAAYGHKWSTTDTSSQTAQESYSKYTTDSRTRTETASSGSMTAGIRLRNPGNVTYTLSTLGITVRHWEEQTKSFMTVATLVPKLGDGITLAPGEETPVLQVEATDLNPDRVKALLKRPDSLYLEAEYFEMENAQGLNFDFLKEITATRTATIIIDPGLENAETYRIATNVERGDGGIYLGVTLGEILNDILSVDFATINREHVEDNPPTNERVLFRVNSLETDLTEGWPTFPDGGFWTVIHSSENPPTGLYDFEEFPVRAGDTVILMYVRDSDGDHVYDHLEQHVGTHDPECSVGGCLDYDGDGLSDEFELNTGWQVTWEDSNLSPHTYSVFSDPTNPDQDGDGLNDKQERDIGDLVAGVYYGTDPTRPDTDRDGIPDGVDPFPLIQAKVLCVDQAADGANNGTSWEHAYTHLQAALQDAQDALNNNDDTDDVAEIWVANGVYFPPSKDEHFELVCAVGLYGGFRGREDDYAGETKRSQRDKDPRTNGTVLSGDLLQNDHEEEYGDNCSRIVHANAECTMAPAVDGFLITGGWTPSEGSSDPNPVFAQCDVTLRNLFFTANKGEQGGAVSIQTPADERKMTISNCFFVQNDAWLDGGAVYLYPGAEVLIEDCLFLGNKAGTSESDDVHGGGAIAANDGSKLDLVIKNTDIFSNFAERGGGVWIGGSSNVDESPVVAIENSRFIENELKEYGGVGLLVWHVGGGLGVGSNTRLKVVQSLFNGNKNPLGIWFPFPVPPSSSFPGVGGAIYADQDAKVTVVNSTIINNEALHLGGGICMRGAIQEVSITIDNSILVGNHADPDLGDVLWEQFNIWPDGTGMQLNMNTSCIEATEHQMNVVVAGFGNIRGDTDSIFSENGVTLKSDSPCIDAGNTYVDFDRLTAGFQMLPETDLAGNPRLVDGDNDGIEDVDMGAYEYQP